MAFNKINQSTLRLTGMSSGLDTASIVRDMLAIDQLKVDRQFKLKTSLEWKGEAYRSVNLQLRSFREKFMSVLSGDNMVSASSYRAFKVSYQKESSAVSVTAGSSAMSGSITINKIEALAKSAKVEGAKLEGITGRSTLEDLAALAGMAFEDVFEKIETPRMEPALGEDGKPILDEDGKPVMNPVLDEDGEPIIDVSYRANFKINGQSFSFSSKTELSDMLSEINSSSGAAVTASFSSLKGAFTVASNATGTLSKVDLENGEGSRLFGAGGIFGLATGEVNGSNAVAYIENVRVERQSNSFTIDGLTYNLREETQSEVKFTVSRNTDDVFDRISNFVKAYNELIEGLQKKLNEDVFSSYGPLTDSEREKLTDKQAEQWDEKAKSGLLKGDSMLTKLVDSMRAAFYTKVGGTGKSAADIGLTTGEWRDGAKITLDEKKLRAALEENPEQVGKIFSAIGEGDTSSERNASSGLVSRMSTAINGYISYVTSETLDRNGIALGEASDRLKEMETWIYENEEKYYQRFTAMEVAMSKLNSQTSWISSLLGGLGG